MSPSHPLANSLFAHYAAARGWGDHAIAFARRALDLDPVSAVANTDLAWVYLLDRQYSKAIEQALSALEMKFNFPLLNMYLSHAYLWLGHACGLVGRRTAACKILDRIEESSKQQYVSAYDRALVHAGLGQNDDALRCLTQALDERAPRAIWINVEPALDRLRADRRFKALVSRLGL